MRQCLRRRARAVCGVAGMAAHPEVGGVVLYTCAASSQVHGGLFLLDVSSGYVRRLTPDNAWNVDASWSPDGRRIAYQSTRDGRSDVYVMDVANGSVRRVSDGKGFNGYPSWSPDGQWIAYESSRGGIQGRPDPPGHYAEIYVVREDGTGPRRRLVDFHSVQSGAAWSPLGDQIAFASDRAGAYDIYTVAADGSGLRQLTHHEHSGGFATYPEWSPDGARIVYDAAPTASGKSSIYSIPADGGQPEQLTDDPNADWDGFPDWSSASGWIVFTRSEGGGLQLMAVPSEGGATVRLTSGPGDKDEPRWRPA